MSDGEPCGCRGCSEPVLDGFTTYPSPHARVYHEVLAPAAKHAIRRVLP